MRYPSAKRIAQICNCDAETARAVRAVLDGSRDPCETSEATADWARACYHWPNDDDLKMHAADALLGNFGVEAIIDSTGRALCEYSNTGDSYAGTIIRDLISGTWKVGSWGDWLEKAERRGIRCY